MPAGRPPSLQFKQQNAGLSMSVWAAGDRGEYRQVAGAIATQRAVQRLLHRVVHMYRVRFDGRLTDMVNLTRAKDTAVSLALSVLNNPKRVAA